MTHVGREPRMVRVHMPVTSDGSGPDARQAEVVGLAELVRRHPGVAAAVAGRVADLLIVEYDPTRIGLADLASILRLAGHSVRAVDS